MVFSLPIDHVKDVRVDIDIEKPPQEKKHKGKRSLQKWKSFPNSANNSYRSGSRGKKWSKDMYSDILEIDGNSLPKLPEEEEAVGIITMEDVIEELLQVTELCYRFYCFPDIFSDSGFEPDIDFAFCRRKYSMRRIISSRTHNIGLFLELNVLQYI